MLLVLPLLLISKWRPREVKPFASFLQEEQTGNRASRALSAE